MHWLPPLSVESRAWRLAMSDRSAAALARVATRQSKAVTRAAKRYGADAAGFMKWQANFFAQEGEIIQEVLEPAFQAAALLTSGNGNGNGNGG